MIFDLIESLKPVNIARSSMYIVFSEAKNHIKHNAIVYTTFDFTKSETILIFKSSAKLFNATTDVWIIFINKGIPESLEYIAQKYKVQLITYTGKKNQSIVLPSLVIFFFTTMVAIMSNTAIESDEMIVIVIFDI